MIYRLYFNREQDWPQLWSIDEGDQTTEFNVIDFRAVGCRISGHALPPAARASLDPKAHPAAWIEIEAAGVRMERGIAMFDPVR